VTAETLVAAPIRQAEPAGTFRVRQSLLGSVDKCLRSAQFSIETPPMVPSGSIQRSLGTGYHAAMERFYKFRMETEYTEPFNWEIATAVFVETALTCMHDDIDSVARAGGSFKWSKEITDVDMADTKLAHMVRSYFEGDHYWPAEFEVVGVEHSFTFADEIMGMPMHGTMDLVLRDPSGYIVIVDHKTCARMWDQSKHKPRKQNQPGFYVHAARKLWPDAAGYRFVYDICSYKGDFERRISDPSPAHEHAVMEKAEQFIVLYKGLRANGMDLPVNPSSNLCSPSFCDYWSICPQGAALDS
jgi:hypothetical protein